MTGLDPSESRVAELDTGDEPERQCCCLQICNDVP